MKITVGSESVNIPAPLAMELSVAVSRAAENWAAQMARFEKNGMLSSQAAIQQCELAHRLKELMGLNGRAAAAQPKPTEGTKA